MQLWGILAADRAYLGVVKGRGLSPRGAGAQKTRQTQPVSTFNEVV